MSCKDPACIHYHTFGVLVKDIQCLFLPDHHPTPPLLRLPGEIRNSIYRLLLLDHNPLNFTSRSKLHLALNKQIYKEARFILYTENVFAIPYPFWSNEGGNEGSILDKPERFKKEDVELIKHWFFQTLVCSRYAALPQLCIEGSPLY